MIRPRDVTYACAAVLFMTVAAAAEESSPGVARSMSFFVLTPDATVAIRPLDNTRANLALKQQFATALKKRAVRVDDKNAPYVLNFETEVDQPVRRTEHSFGSASASNRDSEMHINVWATRQDSLLRGRPDDQTDRGTLRYVLTATLDDERTGRRLWQGEASYAGAAADEAATLAAMASVLADQLGQTVRQKNFRLE
jgi:hypothetical protein